MVERQQLRIYREWTLFAAVSRVLYRKASASRDGEVTALEKMGYGDRERDKGGLWDERWGGKRKRGNG